MSIVRWALVAVTALVATASILSYFGVRRRADKTGPTDETASAVQLYYCPMHPSVVQDHPGQCPICSMTLVPKPQVKVKPSSTMTPSAGQATAATPSHKGVSGLTAIDLSPERIQLIGMRTAVVKRSELGGELRTVGVVAASERGLAQITMRVAGWIEKLSVSETGEHVKRGQVLATVYSPDVLKAQQELLVTRGWAGQGEAKGFEENARRRLELLGISSQEIDEVLRTGKTTDAISIRSPVDGYVIGKNAVVGLAIQPGTVLFQIADLSTVWVTADVHESDVSRVRVGQPARFELASAPGQPQTGKVKFIYPVVDSQNRTLTVRLEFKNRFDRSGPRLRPGTYGNVYLALPTTKGLTVPSEAVVDTGEMQYLFVARQGGQGGQGGKPTGHFEPRLVKVGARQRDQVEILSGVSAGETVVTTGNFLIDSESRLRSAIEGQDSGEAGSQGSTCSSAFDVGKYPEKFQSCRACEIQHRGMGTMEDDCKKAIPKPWR